MHFLGSGTRPSQGRLRGERGLDDIGMSSATVNFRVIVIVDNISWLARSSNLGSRRGLQYLVEKRVHFDLRARRRWFKLGLLCWFSLYLA